MRPLTALKVEEAMNEQAMMKTVSEQQVQKLFVGGEQRLTNEVICYYLGCTTGFSCSAGTLDDLREVIKGADREQLKVILLDYDTPEVREKLGGDLNEFLGQLGGLPTIIFNFNAEARVKRWIAHGVRGLLYMTDPSQNLVKAVKAVIEGQMWMPRQAMSACLGELEEMRPGNGNGAHRLTHREREILTILASGTSNAELAEKLFISPFTVKVHIQNIFKKIGVPNRVKAAIWAQRNLELSN
jgi:DNA-binding NarL/FixJ family response regulator